MNKLICPISGVSIPHFLLSALLGFIFIFVFDFVVHGKILMAIYQTTPQLWRTPEDMQAHGYWMLLVQGLTALITAFIYTRNHEGKGLAEGVTLMDQITVQLIGIAAVGAYCAVLTFVLLKLTQALVGLRVMPEAETEGLDVAEHDERGYIL